MVSRRPNATWARGTGYGHGSKGGEVWNAKAAQIAQERRDAETNAILDGLHTSVQEEVAASGALLDLRLLPDEFVHCNDQSKALQDCGCCH